MVVLTHKGADLADGALLGHEAGEVGLAALAGAVAGAAGLLARVVEAHVGAAREAGLADGAAVDLCGAHGVDEEAVGHGVARLHGGPAGGVVGEEGRRRWRDEEQRGGVRRFVHGDDE